MKLVMMVIGDEYADEITSLLVENNFCATNIGSSGDFLQYGYTVLLLGICEEEIDSVVDLIKKKGQANTGHYDYHEEVMLYVLGIGNYVKVHNIAELNKIG